LLKVNVLEGEDIIPEVILIRCNVTYKVREGVDGRRIGRMGEWDRWEENGTDDRRGREREE